MARICFLSPAQLASNPRLVRNADCLAAAGHVVTVVHADHQLRFRDYDAAIRARARWAVRAIDFYATSAGRRRWRLARLRSYLFNRLLAQSSSEPALLRSVGYFGPEISQAACQVPADIYVAQQQQMVVPAALAARRNGGRYAVDIEDILAENPSERVQQIRHIENRYYASAEFLCTMSDAAADYLLQQYAGIQRPIVLHNCPSLAERRLPPPTERPAGTTPTLYWFGQTIGPHSCAETILRALARLRHRACLVLRGRAIPEYAAKLHALAAELGIPGALRIDAVAAPDAMVPLAGEHAICLGTQPGKLLFHQLAVGNKVCTGILAGAALGLSDTIAHRRLVAVHGQFGFFFQDGDDGQLAGQLDDLLADRDRLATLRALAWRVGETTLNWENESRHLIDRVAAMQFPNPK
jgi:glycosyltransferase involved in cell wall biosynthesis